MKNLCKKGKKIHPSPPPSSSNDHLSLLPATILALTAALSPEDRQVLAYLISCSGPTSATITSPNHRRKTHKAVDAYGDEDGGGDHAPLFDCSCFRCYTSFWARWDNSPNRQLIHEIIEAYEDGLFQNRENTCSKKKKKKERGKNKVSDFELKQSREQRRVDGEKKLVNDESSGELQSAEPCPAGTEDDVDNKIEAEKGTVRKIVSFLGEKIWGVWNTD